MSLIDGYPLRSLADHEAPGELYAECMELVVRLARAGLVHGDFNEFNLMIGREEGELWVIDFPQCVSTSHPDAEWSVFLFLFSCSYDAELTANLGSLLGSSTET